MFGALAVADLLPILVEGFGLTTFGALNLLSFVPGEIGAAARRTVMGLWIVGLLAVAFAYSFAEHTYYDIKCHIGDKESCYHYSWTDYKIEGMTDEAYRDMVHRLGDSVAPENAWWTNVPIRERPYKRWALLRTEWLDGEAVQTRQVCLVDPQFALVNPNESACYDREVMSGKHKGEALAYVRYTDPETPKGRKYRLDELAKRWPNSRW